MNAAYKIRFIQPFNRYLLRTCMLSSKLLSWNEFGDGVRGESCRLVMASWRRCFEKDKTNYVVCKLSWIHCRYQQWRFLCLFHPIKRWVVNTSCCQDVSSMGERGYVNSYNAVVQCNDDKCLEVMYTGLEEHAIF